jgi:hypothetical protein
MSRPRRAAPARSALLLGFAAVLLGLAACASVLGIGDRTLDPELGDGAVGPSDATSSDAASEAPLDGGIDGAVDAHPDTAVVDSGAASEAGGDASLCTASDPGPCVMASGLYVAYAVVSDSNRVYWTEWGDSSHATGAVKSCPLTGCGAGPTVYASAIAGPRGIAIDGQNVYWGATYVISQTEAGIFSCPLAGCTSAGPTMLAPATEPGCLAVGPTDVYWSEDIEGTVYHVPKSTGSQTPMSLYGAGSGLTFPFRCAIDSSSFYVMDEYAGVYRVPLSGGAPILMVPQSATNGVWPLTIDPDTVYFSTGTSIARVPNTTVDASAGIPIVPGLVDPKGVFFDPATSYVYWSDFGTEQGSDGQLGKVGADGGITVLSGGLPRPFALTVSGNDVYWLSESAFDSAGNSVPNTGAIWRQAK